MKNKVIAFITHIQTHQKVTDSHIQTHKETTLSLSLQLCAKKKNIKKEQPELHQLTTKQQRNILSNSKNHTAVKRKNKQTLKEKRTTSKQAMF